MGRGVRQGRGIMVGRGVRQGRGTGWAGVRQRERHRMDRVKGMVGAQDGQG